ncbi:UNVERIFIED_CONTAM: hypothetical protein FKN15_037092 [Acipenser sinensis]
MVYGQILHRSGTEEELINLNVGGFKQKVKQSTLLKFPQTRLGKLLNCESEEDILGLCDDYNVTDKEYYFDRNPCLFRYVLNFYYTGKLHLMEELCVFSFSQEIEYWGITELSLGSCCSSIYQELKEDGIDNDWEQTSDEQQTFDSSFEELSVLDTELEKFEGLWCAEIRKGIWVRLENPGYSISAKLIAIASLSVVLISIVAMCIHSMPEFQKFDASDKEIEDPALAVLEIVCIIFFSMEFMLRLIVAPCRRKFFGNPLNTIDFVSIIPFYATLAIDTVDEESENLENVGKVVQILRLMRIFRILKLARHSVGLRSLGATLRHSYHEVGLLILFLSVGISIFSVLVYAVEKEEDESELKTIPVGSGHRISGPKTAAGGNNKSLCNDEQAPPGKSEQASPGYDEQASPGGVVYESPGKSVQTSPGYDEQASPGGVVYESPGKSVQTSPGYDEQASPGGVVYESPGKSVQTSPGYDEQASPGGVVYESPGKSEQTSPSNGKQASPGNGEQASPGNGKQASPGDAKSGRSGPSGGDGRCGPSGGDRSSGPSGGMDVLLAFVMLASIINAVLEMAGPLPLALETVGLLPLARETAGHFDTKKT